MSEIIATSRDELKPIFQAKPDMRFATTFISNKYRDYAVKGEVIMDKATGEIFTKRPEDARVVSFFQNKKYMTQLMLDLRILLNNNSSFRFPEVDDVNAVFLSTDYDMMTLYKEQDISIIDTDQIIPYTDEDKTKLQFNLSRKTNGFFCRVTSRDADKALIEWLTAQYNYICENYDGTDQEFIDEKDKFNLIEKWHDSNAAIDYEVHLRNNNQTIVYPVTDYVRINEECCVLLPKFINDMINDSTPLFKVCIKAIRYDKIHFMFKHREDLGHSFTDGLAKFMYPDNSIFIRYCNICSFVDKSEEIELLGNEFIIAMMDVPYVRRYLMKLNANTDTNIILSPERPNDETWSANGIWAEQIRDVFRGGYTINLDCEVDLHKLEMYLAQNDDTDYVDMLTFTTKNDIYAEEI